VRRGQPLFEDLLEKVRSLPVVHADETRAPLTLRPLSTKTRSLIPTNVLSSAVESPQEKALNCYAQCGQPHGSCKVICDRMPSEVACPVCGADGTAAANEIIAQSSPPPPPKPPVAGIRLAATSRPSPSAAVASPVAMAGRPGVQPRYKAVAGWLRFFCIVLTVITPLLTLLLLAKSYNDTYKYFERFPRLVVIMVIDSLLSLSLMGYSIYAGVGLWKIRPGAVRTAKRYLVTYLVYLAIAAVLPFTAGLPSAANMAMLGEVFKSFVRGGVFFAIWYSYLTTSQRVKATYLS
jgi:hypothetical protein